MNTIVTDSQMQLKKTQQFLKKLNKQNRTRINCCNTKISNELWQLYRDKMK